MDCQYCGAPFKTLKHASVRKWCSSGCRGEARRKQARAIFAKWLRAPLPERCPDLEGALLDVAPEGAWWYRLSCPGLQNGVPRYFPAGSRWQLRLFEEPAVPWPGYYTVCFYDAHDQLIGMVEEIAVAPSVMRVPIGSGDHRRELLSNQGAKGKRKLNRTHAPTGNQQKPARAEVSQEI